MRGYAAIGLYEPKHQVNVGAALRAAGCYGASMLAVAGTRPKSYMGKICTDTMKTYRHMPVLRGTDLRAFIPYDCVPVAVELTADARSLVDYTHPQRAFYVFGPEDGSVPNEVLGWCRDVVAVPTRQCMNLAATVNVVLYDRMAKG